MDLTLNIDSLNTDTTIQLIQGNDLRINVRFIDSEGTVVDITGAKIWFGVKSNLNFTDEEALMIKKSLAAGGDVDEIEIKEEGEGEEITKFAQIKIKPEDSTGEDNGDGIVGKYKFDIRIIAVPGEGEEELVKTPAIGILNIVRPITIDLSVPEP